MGEVIWVNGGVYGGIGGGDVERSAGGRVFEDGEEGEVVPRVGVEKGVIERSHWRRILGQSRRGDRLLGRTPRLERTVERGRGHVAFRGMGDYWQKRSGEESL